MMSSTHGEADSGVTSIEPTEKMIAKMKWAIARILQRHIAEPREGLY